MSGIFGILSKTGQPIKSSWTASMLENLRHRGPDGAHTWEDEVIVLGHLMMHTTPESCYDKQPLEYEHRVITADVRLDNRKELFGLLNIPLSIRSHITDSLLILKSFEKWGNDCPKYLVGDFAFAIWDKVQRRLFCAKDHAGVRQIFFYESAHYFIFATEVGAIANLEFVPHELNEEVFLLHLLKIYGNGNNAINTLVTGIKRLMPASWLLWENQKLVTTVYWVRNPSNKIKFADDKEYAIALREQIQQAIDDRLRSNYQIGVTLSGGLDSSSIACLAARRLAESGKNLYSASSVLPINHSGIEEDERDFIELILSQETNIIPQFITAEGIGAFDDLSSVFEKIYGLTNSFYYMDRAINQSFASKTRIVLSGYAGDSTVSNYGKMVLSNVFNTLRIKKGIDLVRQKKEETQRPYQKILLSEVIAPLLPANLLTVLLNLKGNPNRRSFRLIDSAVSAQFVSERTATGLLAQEKRRQISQNDHYNSIWNTSTLWFTGENALDSYYGQEYAFPFTDKRVIEFLWASPTEFFHYKGVNRGCLRRAMEGVLPDKILWRRDKSPYSPDFQSRISKESRDLSKYIKAELGGDLSNYLNLENILDRLEKIRPARNWNNVDRSSMTVVHTGIQALMFLKWFKNRKSNF